MRRPTARTLIAVSASAAMLAGAGLPLTSFAQHPKPVSVRVILDSGTTQQALDGRAYVLVAKPSDLDGDEPRDHIDVVDGIPLWGKDVTGLRPGAATTLQNGTTDGTGTYGYPLTSMSDLPKGTYVVQAFFNVYTTVHRSDGSTVSVHFPCGDGANLWQSPGNLYSKPVTVAFDPARGGKLDLRLTESIAPAQPVPAGGTCQQGNPATTPQVKHVKIRSALLSTYWGRDTYIAADVLLPKGYDDPANASVRYPMEVNEGHYPRRNPHGFQDDLSNAFSQWWMSDAAPRFLSVQLRTENPFYDDSYGVNSRNLGPYGDAINTELLPTIDAQFRSIGKSYGRVLTGGSTGGWISLANQLFYPDTYGGVWSGYPDSLDFHAHQVINVYDDPNAYYNEHSWVRVERPAAREISGDIIWTTAQENHWELAMGTHGRSMGQWDVWDAVYGPQGADGYPAAPWDKVTGVIDHSVTDAWRPFDLTDYVQKNWSTLGPKVTGKMHVYVGDADTYFLNNGVNLFDAAVSKLSAPAADAQFVYGRNQPHGWSPWTTPELFGIMASYIDQHSPDGADNSGWLPPAPATPPAASATANGTVSGGSVSAESQWAVRLSRS